MEPRTSATVLMTRSRPSTTITRGDDGEEQRGAAGWISEIQSKDCSGGGDAHAEAVAVTVLQLPSHSSSNTGFTAATDLPTCPRPEQRSHKYSRWVFCIRLAPNVKISALWAGS